VVQRMARSRRRLYRPSLTAALDGSGAASVMLAKFIVEHRTELLSRAQRKTEARAVSGVPVTVRGYGAPVFLADLADVLNDAAVEASMLTIHAAAMGEEMSTAGFSIAELVHRYCDVCDSLAELAAELGAPIGVEEVPVLISCLGTAVAAAGAAFLEVRERSFSRGEAERLGVLTHEQRNLLSAAMFAFQMLRNGGAGIGGKTGAVLGRALSRLREVTNRSLAGVRLTAGVHQRGPIVLSDLIEELEATARIEASAKGMQLTVLSPPQGLTVEGDRLLLASAVSNLLSNAFKYTRANGNVALRTAIAAGQVRIEVEDECGGLPQGLADQLFHPFERRSADTSGLGLGLTISRQGVQANGGTLDVQDLPGKGCVFCIHLPLAA
jgi:signal transduction histidine kinase